MTKTIKSTVEELIESLSPNERREFDEEYQEFLLSEIILATMEKDNVSVKKLAKMARLSPTII